MAVLYVLAGLSAAFSLLVLTLTAALWSKLMATQADLDTALAALKTSVDANTVATNNAVAKISAGGTVDFQPAVDAVNAATAQVDANNQALSAAGA